MSSTTSSESDFDDRYLQCFGLGDSDPNSKPQPNPQSEREQKLKAQENESPWWASVAWALIRVI